MNRLLKSLFSHVHFHLTGVHPPKGFIESLTLLFLILGAGTIFYSEVEGWSMIDSLYFSVITITTVGYGDLHPTLPMSKLFTVFYLFIGMGIGVYVITTFAQSILDGRQKRLKRIEQMLERMKHPIP